MAGNMVGRVLNNRYEMTERVGLGGMAEVYRAQDNVLGRMVAVKVMLPQYAADPTFTQRFRQEAASAAKLQSPYIVSIYDWGLDGETYYIVMEFLRGTDLKSAINERGAINQRKAAEIGSQVAQALSVAHAADIIHRDIKPQNIMIQPDGNIKVMDFGIARAGDAGLSQTSTVLGTAHYVSPEQAQGKELGAASDIYSLGVVLYEATTGSLPFDGQDAVSVAVKQVNEIPAAPSTIKPDIDPTLEAIIMKALEKDPLRRFQSAAEMRKALNDYLAGRPVNLGDDINGLQTQVMGGGVPPIMGDSTSVMPAVARPSNIDATAVQKKGAATYAANETESNRSKKPLIAGVVIAAVVLVAALAIAIFALSNQENMVEVPNVANQTLEEARQTLTDQGFTIGSETEVYSEDVEEGRVVGTNPPAGTMAARGSRIDLSVSKGNEEITVPDLRNMTVDEAQQALRNAGLSGREGDRVYDSNVAEGRVATQDTAAGSTANKDDVIVFHVSRGPEMVDVPNVVGTTESNARASLEGAGFTVTVNYITSSQPEGRVISQGVTGQAERGSIVSITVSNGPAEPEQEPPNVQGQSEAAARQAIEDAGYTCEVEYQSTSDSTQVGKVLSQYTMGNTIVILVGEESSGDSSTNTGASSTTR